MGHTLWLELHLDLRVLGQHLKSRRKILLEDLPEKEARPLLVIGAWPTGLSDVSPTRRKVLLAMDGPSWARQRTPFAQKLFDDLEALRVRYPNVDFDRATGAEILALVDKDSQEV